MKYLALKLPESCVSCLGLTGAAQLSSLVNCLATSVLHPAVEVGSLQTHLAYTTLLM